MCNYRHAVNSDTGNGPGVQLNKANKPLNNVYNREEILHLNHKKLVVLKVNVSMVNNFLKEMFLTFEIELL